MEGTESPIFECRPCFVNARRIAQPLLNQFRAAQFDTRFRTQIFSLTPLVPGSFFTGFHPEIYAHNSCDGRHGDNFPHERNFDCQQWFGERVRKLSLSRQTRGSSGKGKPRLASFVQGSPVAARYRPPASATGTHLSWLSTSASEATFSFGGDLFCLEVPCLTPFPLSSQKFQPNPQNHAPRSGPNNLLRGNEHNLGLKAF